MFLIEIVTLITTLLVKFSYPHRVQCEDLLHLETFYLIIIAISASEILLKTVILAIIYCISREVANIVQIVLTVVYLVLHIAVWIYSIVILKNWIQSGCEREEPDYFYINCFAVVYGIMLIGSVGLVVGMLLPATVLTVFSIKNRQRE